ncbi:hypothetical protein BDW22DRAFT_1350942 [Trametopsis cervina]|nr:hypothetical protein BDW22DRAFT_1350942 [Trametopsis cervina]
MALPALQCTARISLAANISVKCCESWSIPQAVYVSEIWVSSAWRAMSVWAHIMHGTDYTYSAFEAHRMTQDRQTRSSTNTEAVSMCVCGYPGEARRS